MTGISPQVYRAITFPLFLLRPVVLRPAVPGGGHHDLRAALHLGGLQELHLRRDTPRQLRLRTHRARRLSVRDNVSFSPI